MTPPRAAFSELAVEAIFSLTPYTPMSAELYAGRDDSGGS